MSEAQNIVQVERGRVWIKVGGQSFMLAYEADTCEELAWYAKQLSDAIASFTPDVKKPSDRVNENIVPMGIVTILNTVLGTNEWQGDKGRAELLEPAREAICSLYAKAQLVQQAQAPGWRAEAANWLRAKAEAQRQTNAEYPRHVACYPSWTERVRLLEWWADDLDRESANLPQQGAKT